MSVLVGGSGNTASGQYSALPGGHDNTTSGNSATVSGGGNNVAAGDYSFSAGRRAKANHDGAFVWGDSTDADIASTGDNQFIVRASGGIWFGTSSSASIPAGRFINTSTDAHLTIGGAWINASARASKENFAAIDKQEILTRLADIPIETWSYKVEDPSIRRMGPVAQDFYAAFGLGQDDKHISTVDANGVALAAIQGLYELLKEKDARIAQLEARLEKLEKQVEK